MHKLRVKLPRRQWLMFQTLLFLIFTLAEAWIIGYLSLTFRQSGIVQLVSYMMSAMVWCTTLYLSTGKPSNDLSTHLLTPEDYDEDNLQAGTQAKKESYFQLTFEGIIEPFLTLYQTSLTFPSKSEQPLPSSFAPSLPASSSRPSPPTLETGSSSPSPSSPAPSSASSFLTRPSSSSSPGNRRTSSARTTTSSGTSNLSTWTPHSSCSFS